MKVLMHGNPIYEPSDANLKTKSECEDEIRRLQAELDDPNSEVNYWKSVNNMTAYENAVKARQALIAELQAQKRNAPDFIERKLATGKFISSSNGIENVLSLSVESDLRNDSLATFDVVKHDNNKRDYLSFKIEHMNRRAKGKVTPAGDKLKGMTKNKESAITTADEFIKSLGLTEMKLFAVGAMPYSSNAEDLDANSYDDLNKCFTLYYTRHINDVPFTYINSRAFALEDMPKYAESWADECVQIKVADIGVVGFDYKSPLEMKEKLSENTELLPFDKIKERFVQQIELSGSYNKGEKIVSRTITIDKVVLGYAKIPVKDSPTESMLVPVWDFYGTSMDKYDSSLSDPNWNENNERFVDDFCYSFLTINAIDGSVVERISSISG
jgi:hypothetical protein